MKQSGDHTNEYRLINVRTLAALDIVFHGGKIILTEFLVALFLCGAIGAYLLFFPSSHTFASTVLGLYLLGVAINYIPLLFFALLIKTRDRARRETELEMSQPERYARKYSLQSILFILIPFSLALLALYQLVTRQLAR